MERKYPRDYDARETVKINENAILSCSNALVIISITFNISLFYFFYIFFIYRAEEPSTDLATPVT